MKKIVLAALLLVAAFGSKAQTLPLDLAAYRALLAGPSHFGCTTPLCRTKTIQAAEADSLYGFLLRLSGLLASSGNLDYVLNLGNVSDIAVRIENTSLAFYTLHNHYGITTVHNPYGFADEYPVTFLGWESGAPVLKIRDMFGYFGYIKAGTLTAPRKIRIPNEGDGLDWKSDAVIHETKSPTHVNQYPYGRTETGGGYSTWKDTTTGKIAKITTYGGAPALSLQDASSSGYSVFQSGSISGSKTYLTPNASGTLALINDTVGGSGANPVLLTVYSSSATPGNFATADLTLTGNRYHNADRYNIDIDSANMFTLQDTSGNYALNINDTANYGNSLIYVSSRDDKTLRLSPSTTFQSRLFLQSISTQNLGQLLAGSNQIYFNQTSSGICNLAMQSGAGSPARVVLDSIGAQVSVTHLGGITSTPTILAATGAGTSPTVSITGTDLSGYISVTTGTTCGTDATVVTITFNIPYASAPKAIILSPANKITQNLTKGKECFVDQASIAGNIFAITSNTTALTDATAYKWYYVVIQ